MHTAARGLGSPLAGGAGSDTGVVRPKPRPYERIISLAVVGPD